MALLVPLDQSRKPFWSEVSPNEQIKELFTGQHLSTSQESWKTLLNPSMSKTSDQLQQNIISSRIYDSKIVWQIDCSMIDNLNESGLQSFLEYLKDRDENFLIFKNGKFAFASIDSWNQLVHTISRSSLKTIGFHNTLLDYEHLQSLATSFKDHSSLSSLYFLGQWRNKISPSSMKEYLTVFELFQTLKHLYFENDSFTDQDSKDLAESRLTQRNIQTISLESKSIFHVDEKPSLTINLTSIIDKAVLLSKLQKTIKEKNQDSFFQILNEVFDREGPFKSFFDILSLTIGKSEEKNLSSLITSMQKGDFGHTLDQILENFNRHGFPLEIHIIDALEYKGRRMPSIYDEILEAHPYCTHGKEDGVLKHRIYLLRHAQNLHSVLIPKPHAFHFVPGNFYPKVSFRNSNQIDLKLNLNDIIISLLNASNDPSITWENVFKEILENQDFSSTVRFTPNPILQSFDCSFDGKKIFESIDKIGFQKFIDFLDEKQINTLNFVNCNFTNQNFYNTIFDIISKSKNIKYINIKGSSVNSVDFISTFLTNENGIKKVEIEKISLSSKKFCQFVKEASSIMNIPRDVPITLSMPTRKIANDDNFEDQLKDAFQIINYSSFSKILIIEDNEDCENVDDSDSILSSNPSIILKDIEDSINSPVDFNRLINQYTTQDGGQKPYNFKTAIATACYFAFHQKCNIENFPKTKISNNDFVGWLKQQEFGEFTVHILDVNYNQNKRPSINNGHLNAHPSRIFGSTEDGENRSRLYLRKNQNSYEILYPKKETIKIFHKSLLFI